MRKVVPAILFFAALATLFGEEAFRIWGESHHDPHELYDLWPGASFWTPTLIVQAAMTVIFIGACLYVIVSKRYGPTERHWAFGTLGKMCIRDRSTGNVTGRARWTAADGLVFPPWERQTQRRTRTRTCLLYTSRCV